jgi:hypothetical protein
LPEAEVWRTCSRVLDATRLTASCAVAFTRAKRFHSRQAAGSCRENDGGLLVGGAFQGIEIKGSGGKGETRTTFTFKDIRLQGAH